MIKNKNNKKINTSFGFTLIEIMVAVSIFALVMVVAIGAVLSIVSANKKSQALSSVLSNLNFSLDSMVRDLRTGFDYDCNGGGDCATDGSDNIEFYSTQSLGSVTYGLETLDGVGVISKVSGTGSQYLSSTEVDIDDLKFYVVGTTKTTSGDYTQPKIIIIVRGHYNGQGGDQTEFHLQTMVSQRRIDI